MAKRLSGKSGSRDVDAYIAKAPRDVQAKLKEIRAAIMEAAPGATETTEYFQWPGYYYPGYDYNGMFVWFRVQGSRLSVMVRPPTIEMHRKELAGYSKTKAALHLPSEGAVPVPLIKKLVKTSLGIMKDGKAAPKDRPRRA